MGVFSKIESVAGSVSAGLRGIAGVATALGGGTWEQSLRIASLGGVPFAVESATTAGGRQSVVHAYPFRDTVWVEDMGKLARRFQIYGFLVENSVIYGGGGVVAQRDRLLRAVESKPGDSIAALNGLTLVHPTLGTIRNVSCLGPIEFLERADAGRVLQFRVTLLQGGPRFFPASVSSTGDVVARSADSLFGAAVETLQRAMSVVQEVGSAITQAVSTAMRWVGVVRNAINDVRSIGAALSILPGRLGRLFGGSAKPSRLPSPPIVAAQRLAANAEARAVAIKDGNTLVAAAGSIFKPQAFADAARAQAKSVAATATDPADRVRLLALMVSFHPADPMPSGVLGQAMSRTQGACAAMLRRSALAELARASAEYEPASFDDAVATRDQVTRLLDTEIQLAGDTGEDAVYQALREVRQAVVQDMDTRGGRLSRMRDVSVATDLPAPVLSIRLYRTGQRSDELVVQTDPDHPAFMPTRFRALDA
ncbi:DNA circularization protein [Achromobacter sp. AONIH1]|uniref:DNA circularization protein n=1 Tax=Achromobacter sp. AONIH1 TaxID=1758194 RepID=UPI000CD3273E|nr:DNA circularization N-terminal domain-containing protein [Achromobacter sp. AONIH1]AUT47016.1 hypothetical protein C2U31_14055 [Achromobacter sp. AONIH1]